MIMSDISDAKSTTMSLSMLGDYVGKSVAKQLSDDFKAKQVLEEWLKSKPNISAYDENGIAHFMQNFLSPIFRELFEGANATIKIRMTALHTLLRVIDFEFKIK